MVDSVFLTLVFARRNAIISFFETFEYAFWISASDTRKEERFAPVNFLSYFFTAESPFFWTFFRIDSTIDLFFWGCFGSILVTNC